MFSAAPLSKKYSTTSSNSCGVRIVSGNWITDLRAFLTQPCFARYIAMSDTSVSLVLKCSSSCPSSSLSLKY